MIGSWAKAGAVIGLLIGLKEGGGAIIAGPIVMAGLATALRRWIGRTFGS